MKKLPILVLSLITLPVKAQSILSILNDYQATLSSQGSSSSSGATAPEVKPDEGGTASSSEKCTSDTQTSLPLKYVTSLILEENASLNVLHDPRTGALTVSSPKMISNCSSMIQWKLKKPTIQGKQAYAVEAVFKLGENCTGEKGCSYKVAKVKDGEFQKYEEMSFKPDLNGFKECLKQSGVIVDNKLVPGSIYSSEMKERFSGIDQSGKIYFLSSGPVTPLEGAKYGNFEYVNGCEHYEAAHPNTRDLLTYEDAERARLDEEAAKLKECKVEEYQKLSDFIEKYEGYASELGEVRDRLILEAVKKAAEAIDKGSYTDEDLKIIADFDKYVIGPKVDQARLLYEEMLELEGDAKKAKQEELVKVLGELKAFDQKPYFLSTHTQKLLDAGRFEDAEKLNSLKLLITHHKNLGSKQNNIVITPGVASQRIGEDRSNFTSYIEKAKETYEIKTGQVTGRSAEYSNNSAAARERIQQRNKNFVEEIRLEQARMQPGGYCYRYWRNAQKCLQDSQERIKELIAELGARNKVDQDIIAENDKLAQEYGELEAQGRRYVAAQNGEPVPEEPAAAAPAVDTTRPAPRTETNDPGVYSFNFQQPNYQMPQGQPGQPGPQNYQPHYPQQPNPYQQYGSMFQQPNPFQPQPYQYGQQQPWLGQQSFGGHHMYGQQGGGAYNFNWGGGGAAQNPYQQNPYQHNPYGYQQPQQGYWNQPHQAFNQYSIFGRTW